MELLKEVASVAGKPGLYKVLKPTRNGVILETLDEKKQKLIIGSSTRISVLKEISIFSTEGDDTVSLGDVLFKIKDKFADKLLVNPKSEPSELFSFMADVLPSYDRDRVHASDVKKIVSWYNILSEFLPEVFEVNEPEVEVDSKPETTISASVAEVVKDESSPETIVANSEEKTSKPKKTASKVNTDAIKNLDAPKTETVENAVAKPAKKSTKTVTNDVVDKAKTVTKASTKKAKSDEPKAESPILTEKKLKKS